MEIHPYLHEICCIGTSAENFSVLTESHASSKNPRHYRRKVCYDSSYYLQTCSRNSYTKEVNSTYLSSLLFFILKKLPEVSRFSRSHPVALFFETVSSFFPQDFNRSFSRDFFQIVFRDFSLSSLRDFARSFSGISLGIFYKRFRRLSHEVFRVMQEIREPLLEQSENPQFSVSIPRCTLGVIPRKSQEDHCKKTWTTTRKILWKPLKSVARRTPWEILAEASEKKNTKNPRKKKCWEKVQD